MIKSNHILRTISKRWENCFSASCNTIVISSEYFSFEVFPTRMSYIWNSFYSYDRYAISVRTAGLLPIDECRGHKSFKNDPTEWKQLCIEGRCQKWRLYSVVRAALLFNSIWSAHQTVAALATVNLQRQPNTFTDQKFVCCFLQNELTFQIDSIFKSHLIGLIRRVRVVMKKSSSASRKSSLNLGICWEIQKILTVCSVNRWHHLHSAPSTTITRR